MDTNLKPQHTEEQGIIMSDEWLKFSTDVIDRLSRMETTLTQLDKTVRGNGTPGLVQRVDALESANDTKTGANKVKTRLVASAVTVVLALLGTSVTLSVAHENKAEADRAAQTIYLQKQDSRIQAVEINVAVLMAGLRGAPGKQGKTGAKGDKGVKGARLF
jgi:hypothetical protein